MSLDPVTRAAIIGGVATLVSVCGALIGVYFNLAWNRKQHRDERSLTLRRDVYLETISVINRAESWLARRSVPKTKSETNLNDQISSELSASCAKCYLLGSKKVVAAVVAFQSAFESWSYKFSEQQITYDQIDKHHNELAGESEVSRQTSATWFMHGITQRV